MGLSKSESKIEAKKIFSLADIDQSGYLEFNEWCTVTMSKRKLLKRDHLKAAFRMLDKDNSGTISVDEIKDILMK